MQVALKCSPLGVVYFADAISLAPFLTAHLEVADADAFAQAWHALPAAEHLAVSPVEQADLLGALARLRRVTLACAMLCCTMLRCTQAAWHPGRRLRSIAAAGLVLAAGQVALPGEQVPVLLQLQPGPGAAETTVTARCSQPGGAALACAVLSP